MTFSFRSAALAATLLASGIAPGVAQAAPKQADLTVAKAATPARTIAQGGSLSVTFTVKNAGKGKAAKSTTALVLSTDAKLDKADVRLATAGAKAIKAAKTVTGTLTGKVPASAAARRYTLLVCAD